MRGMVDATVGAACTIRREHAVDCNDHVPLRGAWREGKRDGVESAIELKGRGELFVRHPEYAVGFVVRQRGIRRRFEHELRRQNNSGKMKRLFCSVEHG